MSSQSTARSLPVLEASPLEQAAELVEDFVLQQSLASLDKLVAAPAEQAAGPGALDEALAMAAALRDQSRLVDEEISRDLGVQQRD